MIEKLREVERGLQEAHYSGALDTDAILECVQQVIEELQGERAAYHTERRLRAEKDNDDLFGAAAERDGSAWTQKKKEERL